MTRARCWSHCHGRVTT